MIFAGEKRNNPLGLESVRKAPFSREPRTRRLHDQASVSCIPGLVLQYAILSLTTIGPFYYDAPHPKEFRKKTPSLRLDMSINACQHGFTTACRGPQIAHLLK
jgi:hypothetical protein